MSSGSNAGDTGAARERFSSPLAALGIALSFFLLLLVLFPEKRIVRGIDDTSELTPVALDYRESMLRLHPADAGLRVKLAEALEKTGRYRKALQTLNGFAAYPQGGYRNRYLLARCLALNGILTSKGSEESDGKLMLEDLSRTARELADDGAAPEQILHMAMVERDMGDVNGARYLVRKYVLATALSTKLTDLSSFAKTSGGAGKAWESAAFYFSAMSMQLSPGARRALFVKGVRSLQSGGLPVEALDAGGKYLGTLGTDRDTLLFMANVALSADRPRIAEFYIKKALGMKSTEGKTGPRS